MGSCLPYAASLPMFWILSLSKFKIVKQNTFEVKFENQQENGPNCRKYCR